MRCRRSHSSKHGLDSGEANAAGLRDLHGAGKALHLLLVHVEDGPVFVLLEVHVERVLMVFEAIE